MTNITDTTVTRKFRHLGTCACPVCGVTSAFEYLSDPHGETISPCGCNCSDGGALGAAILAVQAAGAPDHLVRMVRAIKRP